MRAVAIVVRFDKNKAVDNNKIDAPQFLSRNSLFLANVFTWSFFPDILSYILINSLLLESHGLSVIIAQNGEKAISYLRETGIIDAVLKDIQFKIGVKKKGISGQAQRKNHEYPLINDKAEGIAMEKKVRILIVDDEKSNITVLWDALKSDYTVQAAKNGLQAIKAAEQFLPDLILLDIIMPEMDGYSVCTKLKSRPETRHIPIIFITTKSTDDDEEKGLHLGAVDYIIKPFSPAIVRARVQTHLDLKAHRDHLEKLVEERTEELSVSNKNLKQKTTDLEETNIALRLLLKEKNTFLKEFEEKIIVTIKDFILPMLNKIRLGKLSEAQKSHADLIELNINSIKNRSEFITTLMLHGLTADEFQIANLIVDGKKSKDIADLLNRSISTVQSDRKIIRKKLRITNKKIELKEYLASLVS